jgi:acyl carrier protein
MPAETHSHRGEIGIDDVRAIVLDRLSELLGRDPDDLSGDARLREDLDADDFALIDLFDSIEDELGERTVGFRLDDDELAELVTVDDVVDCVVGRLDLAREQARQGEP